MIDDQDRFEWVNQLSKVVQDKRP